MIQPLLSHDALLADIHAAASNDPDALHLWWLGQSGYLVQWRQTHLLLDPYLSDSLTHKYADTEKPHTRMTEIPVAPERLDFVDLVTSTHNHTDHLDGETLIPLLRANPALTVVVPEANRDFAAHRLGVMPTQLTGITVKHAVTVGEITLHAVPAAHETLKTDEFGRHQFVGYVIELGPFTIYHSGDTLLYDGLAERLRELAAQIGGVDLAILPINGRDPARGVAGNLSGAEAATLAHEIGARMVLPCHYDMFTFNTAAPDEFVATAQRLGQPHAVLQCSERYRLDTA